jgi:hypothetical protein
MGRPILWPFTKFTAEAAIIGRLSAGYTSLEMGLLNCVQVARDDFDAVLKAMFRVRGESARIGMAEGFAWHVYEQHGLDAEFKEAISAMRKCTSIRNQYAHCVWYDDTSGKLAFVNVEEAAQEKAYVKDLAGLTTMYVDEPLLQKQEDFYVYVDELLAWVNYEGRLRAGKLKSNGLTRPVALAHPALHL